MTQVTAPLDSVQRAFEVVDALDRLQGAGPSELADHLGLSKSTAHVYLRSLQSAGYAVNRNGEYRLSHQFFTTGSRQLQRNALFQATEGEVATLAADTDEVAVLLEEERGKTVILRQHAGDRSLDIGSYPGMELPIHTHVSGKIFLAHMSPERRESVLDRHGLPPVTDRTLTDRAALDAELEAIRDRGHAFDWDEHVVGMGGVGVPIFVDGDLEGALAVTGPTGRIKDEEYRSELLQHLHGAVDSIIVKYKFGR